MTPQCYWPFSCNFCSMQSQICCEWCSGPFNCLMCLDCAASQWFEHSGAFTDSSLISPPLFKKLIRSETRTNWRFSQKKASDTCLCQTGIFRVQLWHTAVLWTCISTSKLIETVNTDAIVPPLHPSSLVGKSPAFLFIKEKKLERAPAFSLNPVSLCRSVWLKIS